MTPNDTKPEKAEASVVLPDLPRAAVTFADHSFPAYSAKQMREYAQAAALQSSSSAEAERDTALTAITDARQALAEAGISMPFLDDGVKALATERDALQADLAKAEQDRDALLQAGGWKTGPLTAARDIILKETTALRPAMVEARRERYRYEDDALLWQMSVREGMREPLLVRVWEQRRAATKRVKVLEEALRVAEAALADIGDADREPGDDLAWCERRAATVLPPVRAALNHGKGEDARAAGQKIAKEAEGER